MLFYNTVGLYIIFLYFVCLCNRNLIIKINTNKNLSYADHKYLLSLGLVLYNLFQRNLLQVLEEALTK